MNQKSNIAYRQGHKQLVTAFCDAGFRAFLDGAMEEVKFPAREGLRKSGVVNSITHYYQVKGALDRTHETSAKRNAYQAHEIVGNCQQIVPSEGESK